VHFPRASGILLHPTSLPGSFGIGDLGRSAYAFVDFLVAAGQTYWQVLPLGPTGYGDSPYQCFSAFAGNTNLISPDILRDEGLLSDDDLARMPKFPADQVDFGPVIDSRDALLRQAFARYRSNGDNKFRGQVYEFARVHADWLEDYALFGALKSAHGGAAWIGWEHDLARRDPAALRYASDQFRDEVEAQKFFQFLFFKQWFALKAYASDRGVRVIGDIPIFVAFDSADVWTNPEQFKLTPELNPRVVAGVPPDYFSPTGQLWGNPIYDWERMATDGFHWWIDRLRSNLQLVDVLRLDHFRGFSACWEVPTGDDTAVNGQWVDAPGHQLFAAAKTAFGEIPIIAEDLGVITPEVEALRDETGFPGMRVLQFGFGSNPENQHLPHNYVHNVVAYTGTHDNDTAVGWFESQANGESTRTETQVDDERAYALRYLNTNGVGINWDFIRAVWGSVADTAIAPLQDLLGAGNEARFNLPASDSGNWSWRFPESVLTPELGARLRELTEIYGRTRRSVEKEHS
jgi:4-alpha-glucanotransferase